MSTDTPDRKALLREALRTVEDLQKRLDASERARREPVAVVGIGCRYPGAEDPDALWRLLAEGVDAIREVPAGRWDPETLDGGDVGERGRTAACLGGFLDRVDLFDEAFFGISPREAATLDPQQRLLLEVAWETLENAGQAPDRLVGSSTGVFIGITTSDYSKIVGVGEGAHTDVYAATGNALNAAAGRIAFVLGLQGPCVSVDTACSSSLTAIHLASQALRAGECDLALAGGVNVILSPNAALLFARWGMLAADGRCKTFDARADGFIRAEGCGMVALKRLSTALEQGDRILALLLGSAVNQDGASSGLTVPNGLAQQAVLRRALAAAGVAPAEVDYVEAHGTGTPIGDPIEVEALASVLGKDRDPGRPLKIGSIKTNIGHAEAAAGVAGLLKVVLSLQNETIPPHLHVQELNPRFPWGDAITVPTSALPWTRAARRRVAGVSAFGFSGTNAHVVLAESPAEQEAPRIADRPLHLLPLSAKNEAALAQAAARLAAHLEKHPSLDLADVAFTLGTGRATLQHRAAIVAPDPVVAQQRLKALAAGDEAPGVKTGKVRPGERPRIAFLFTGQGSQQAGMGRGLYDSEPAFRRALDRCNEALRPRLERPLLDVMFGAPGTDSLLDQTGWTQPALFALEWSLAELLRSWGIEPDAVLGHSIGELAAACVAGVMAVEDGLALAAERGRLMQAQPPGAMLAVQASEEGVARLLEPWRHSLSIAAVNGPESVVVSGEPPAMEELRARLAAAGFRCEALRVSHAFHSPMMDSMLDPLERYAGRIRFESPRIDLVSNLTGEPVAAGGIDARYWRRHARGAVRFAASISAVRAQGCDVFVEVGPHPTLLGLARQSVADGAFVPTLRRGQAELDTVLDAVAELFVRGTAVDWAAFDRDRPRKKLALPTVAFQRSRCWVEQDARDHVASRRGEHRLLGRRLDLSTTPDTTVWEGEIGIPLFPYLRDHRVQHGAVVPATAWTEIALEAFVDAHGAGPMVLEGIDYLKPLFPQEDKLYAIQVVLTGTKASSRFEISSRTAQDDGSPTEPWTRSTTGRIRRGEAPPADARPTDPDRMRAACPEEVSGEEFYRLLRERGNDWGPLFQGLRRVFRGAGEAWSEVTAPDGPGGLPGYQLTLPRHAASRVGRHRPLQAARGPKGGAFVGGAIDEIRLYGRPRGRSLIGEARLRSGASDDTNLLVGDVRVFDDGGVVGDDEEHRRLEGRGALVSELRGARLWYLDDDAVRLRRVDVDDRLFEVAWRPVTSEAEQRSAASRSHGAYVVVAEDDLAHRCAEQLATSGVECRVLGVEAGAVTERLETSLAELGDRCDGVVCHVAPAPEGESLTAIRDAGLDLALRVAQVCLRRSSEAAPRLWLATTGSQPVGGPPASPLGAAVWGLGRSLALEHSDAWGGLIDLDPQYSADTAAGRLVECVLAASGEDQVACRGDARFGARLVPSRGSTSSRAMRADATYLVTGGRGGLGLEVARSLAQRGARRIVLMGRTPPPPREEWAALAGQESQQGRLVRVLLEIEAVGATLFPAAVDVSNRGELEAWYQQFGREAWPRVRGVVHAAGALLHCAVLDEDEDGLEAIFGAKVRGAVFLNELLATNRWTSSSSSRRPPRSSALPASAHTPRPTPLSTRSPITGGASDGRR
jgi:acyl transferase domain-containing protein